MKKRENPDRIRHRRPSRINRNVHLVSLFSQKRRSLSDSISLVLNRNNALTSSSSSSSRRRRRRVVDLVVFSFFFCVFFSFFLGSLPSMSFLTRVCMLRVRRRTQSRFSLERRRRRKPKKRKLHFPSIFLLPPVL